MTFEDFMSILGCSEEYPIKDKLMNILLSEEKDNFMQKLINNGFDTERDYIREMFELELANRKSLKQDYTPECLCKLVSELCGEQEKILDICGGVGSLSISNITENTSFEIEEKSDVSIALCLLNMAIRNVDAVITKKDVLTCEKYDQYILKKSSKFSTIEKANPYGKEETFKCIISNPPYSLKWEPFNDERFWNYGLAPKTKADYAFILDALFRLEEGGRAFLILPHGVLFRNNEEGKIRKALLFDGCIDCIIGMPDKLFMNTSIPVCIISLVKGRKERNVLFIDASKQFKKDKKQNVMRDEHIEHVLELYKNRADVDKEAHLASFEEIEANDFNLNIPRYVDTSEEVEEIDIHAVTDEIIQLENNIHSTSVQISELLSQLNGPDEYMKEKNRLIEQLQNQYVHDVSDALQAVNKFINSNEKIKKYKSYKLLDIVQIEKAKKGKVYPKGCTLIQLSATKGEMEYLDKDQPVVQKYGVMIPIKKDINTEYLFRIIQMTMPNFLAVYQTGLNLVPDVFKFMNVFIHDDVEVQNEINELLNMLDRIEENEKKNIQKWKELKAYHLDGMFI